MKDNVRDLLQLYCEKAFELTQYSAYGINPTFNLKGAVGIEGLYVTSTLPSKEEFQAFSSCLRKFWANKDSISFYKIRNLARKEASGRSKELVGVIDMLKQKYDDATTSGGILFQLPNRSYGISEVLDLFFNAEVIHCDLDKFRQWASLKSGWVGQLVLFEIVVALLNMANIVVELANQISLHLLNTDS